MQKLASICLILALSAASCFTTSCKKAAKDAENAVSKVELPETPQPKRELIAEAVLEAKNNSGVSGKITFTQINGDVHMIGEIFGATPGEHAIHIHAIGDCSAADGSSAGGHWNPGEVDHGKWGDGAHHAGDIGNIVVKQDGSGLINHKASTDHWTIGGGAKTDILGKSMIIHAGIDDFTGASGNAGPRIACGVILGK